jgi:transposase
MGESGGIDSSGGRTMPKAYSVDIRMRVIARVEGGASRRDAAEQLDISPSAAVQWVKCFRETGSCAAKPRGGSTSPLEAHAQWLLTLIEKQPDLTLDEVVSAMHKHGIAGSRTAVWTFFKRHNISFKKKACVPRSRIARTWPGHVDAGSDGKPCLIRPDWCSSTRPRPTRKWSG